MARLKGLGSFLLIVGVMLLALRLVHVATPLLFPGARPGPFVLTRLEEVRARAGFAPMVPAYHPAALGDRPASVTVSLEPWPTLVVVWRGERTLTVTQRRGGPAPSSPPLARPLTDVPHSTWWWDGRMHHLVLRRGAFWIDLVTDLPSRDLGRLADTLPSG